jgi:hypothetical protein
MVIVVMDMVIVMVMVTMMILKALSQVGLLATSLPMSTCYQPKLPPTPSFHLVQSLLWKTLHLKCGVVQYDTFELAPKPAINKTHKCQQAV